ncbi:hypothetical protein [Drosophila suzukii associated hytrosavirus 1]|nr:hypothetical protein [Drosophila suzukii associated hytrosavirus 1]
MWCRRRNRLGGEKMPKRKSLTVSHLIRKFNILLNANRHESRLSSACICLFRLYGDVRIDDACPVHTGTGNIVSDDTENNKLINTILKNFIEKNILYINTMDYDKIIYATTIHMMLPLILHIHMRSDGTYHHIPEKSAIQNLSNPCVHYAHLLIINFEECQRPRCSFAINKLLSPHKLIRFRYAIFINCHVDRRIQFFMQKMPYNDSFYLKLGEFLHSDLL